MKIGVFDSGLGGLTVAKEIMEKNKGIDIVYISDNLRAPYGDKKDEEVREYTYEMISFLIEKKVEMLIIACNTITSFLLEEIKENVNIPVIGVIEPAVKRACETNRENKILILGTNKTIEKNIYEQKIKKMDKEKRCVSLACPEFVPMIENGNVNNTIIYKTLSGINKEEIETIILGCTHYPLIKKEIQKCFKQKINFVDSAYYINKELEEYNFEKTAEKHEFYTTGSCDKFNKVLNAIIGKKYKSEKVKLKKSLFLK